MNLFLLSDLHLALANPVRLAAFGHWWNDHEPRMAKAWDNAVGLDDLVLVPGDISWAQTANAARPDMTWLGARPGRIYLSPGNHDRWWRSQERLAGVLPRNATPVPGDWLPFHGGMIASTLGMTAPSDRFFGPRERQQWPGALQQLRQLLDRLPERQDQLNAAFSILMMHYPPCDGLGVLSEMGALVEAAGVTLCVYGHFHQPAEWANARLGLHGSTTWAIGSADALGFAPLRLGSIRRGRLTLLPITPPPGPES